MSSPSSPPSPSAIFVFSRSFLFLTLLLFIASQLLFTCSSAAYAGQFELPSSSDYHPKHQASPPSSIVNVPNSIAECSPDSVRADFGTACLKKKTSSSSGSSSASSRPHPVPGRSRYFAVKPMLVQTRQKSFGVKSPALSARELYASKGGYPGAGFPVKSVRTVSGTSLNMAPVSPTNKFYSVKPTTTLAEQPPAAAALPLTPILDPTAILAEDDEWRDADREQIVADPELNPPLTSSTKVTTGQSRGPPPHHFGPNHQGGNQGGAAGSVLTTAGNGQYSEELEMLQSLKRSLGVLSAQALNLKQRSALLYREARKRKLYFFDALLSRTHSFLADKTTETRNALADIDTAISQIKLHHREAEAALVASLRRNFYFYERQPANSFTSRRMKKRNTSKIDPREVDQLILDALNHAKRMMTIVRELNEAMDEFEEQFNLPRFEPNRVQADGSNAIDGGGASSEEF